MTSWIYIVIMYNNIVHDYFVCDQILKKDDIVLLQTGECVIERVVHADNNKHYLHVIPL